MEISIQCDYHHTFLAADVEKFSNQLLSPNLCRPRGLLQAAGYGGEGQLNAGGLDQAEVSSCLRQGQDLIIHQGSCEGQCLPNVFVLKLGVFAFEFSSIGIGSQRLEHSAHRKAKVTYARLPIQPGNVGCDSVELFHPSSSLSRLAAARIDATTPDDGIQNLIDAVANIFAQKPQHMISVLLE